MWTYEKLNHRKEPLLTRLKMLQSLTYFKKKSIFVPYTILYLRILILNRSTQLIMSFQINNFISLKSYRKIPRMNCFMIFGLIKS